MLSQRIVKFFLQINVSLKELKDNCGINISVLYEIKLDILKSVCISHSSGIPPTFVACGGFNIYLLIQREVYVCRY
jgi:hypothetical protein